jgi:hypothetical protein
MAEGMYKVELDNGVGGMEILRSVAVKVSWLSDETLETPSPVRHLGVGVVQARWEMRSREPYSNFGSHLQLYLALVGTLHSRRA